MPRMRSLSKHSRARRRPSAPMAAIREGSVTSSSMARARSSGERGAQRYPERPGQTVFATSRRIGSDDRSAGGRGLDEAPRHALGIVGRKHHGCGHAHRRFDLCRIGPPSPSHDPFAADSVKPCTVDEIRVLRAIIVASAAEQQERGIRAPFFHLLAAATKSATPLLQSIREAMTNERRSIGCRLEVRLQLVVSIPDRESGSLWRVMTSPMRPKSAKSLSFWKSHARGQRARREAER